MTLEGGQGETAVEPRLRMARDQRQHLVECRKRVLRTPQRQQRVAAVEQRVDIAGLQCQSFVETLERLLVPLERVQHDPEIDPRVCRARIYFERRGDEPVGFSGLSARLFDGTEEIEGVELTGTALSTRV